jgi:hypothetical protein
MLESKKFNPGDQLILDKNEENPLIVEVILQTPNGVFTTVKTPCGREMEVATERLYRSLTDEMMVYMSDDMYLPIHYKGIKVEQPFYKGDGQHSVNELQSLCNQFSEYIHQQQIIKQNCMKHIVYLKFNR